jgi:D-beta-D-heptose 7-phosphate kinase/D-beta-D-heptose 1-phosphate adenosyltransferase
MEAILKRFPGQRILVLGDVILDRYWWGEASRLSPEAPVPVVRLERSTVRPGGAGNTAANLVAMGASVSLFGVTGEDAQAAELKAVLTECGVPAEHLLADSSRRTTSKTRVVAMHQQVVRVDDENTSAISEQLASAAALAVAAELDASGAIVISDYAKGFLTPGLLETVLARANQAGRPVFVDPKGSDYMRYRGSTFLKPNRGELGLLTGMPVTNHQEAVAAGRRLSSLMPGTLVLVTEGAEGMTLFADSQQTEHVASTPRQVFDVTGAGDTVLAALAMGITAGATPRQAMRLALEAAGIAIAQMGAVAVSLQEMREIIPDHSGLIHR